MSLTSIARDLVMLMLMCCNITDYPASPGSPYRTISAKIIIALLRSNWRALQAPLSPDDVTTMWRIKMFLTALMYTGAELGERLLALLKSPFKYHARPPDSSDLRPRSSG